MKSLMIPVLTMCFAFCFYGCQNQTGGASTQPTATDVYSTVNAVAQGVESVASTLAATGVIPQIDVSLGIAALNTALTAWHNALNPPIGSAGDPVAVAKAEADVHAKIAALETLISQGKQKQVQAMK